MNDYPNGKITLSVNGKIYKEVARRATASGMFINAWAMQLFEAALAARVKPPTGDTELDEAMAALVFSGGDEALRKELRETAAKLESAAVREKALQDKISQLIDNVVRPPVFRDPDERMHATTVTEAQVTAESGAVIDASVAEVASLRRQLEEEQADHDKIETDLQDKIDELSQALAEAESKPRARSDDLITTILIAWGTNLDTADIAMKTGLSEATVSRILNGWRAARTEKVAA